MAVTSRAAGADSLLLALGCDSVAKVRGANGRGVSRGRFRVVGCGAFRLDFDGGLGGEAEETALFLPVMRQVFAPSQQPDRRLGRGKIPEMPKSLSPSHESSRCRCVFVVSTFAEIVLNPISAMTPSF